MTIGAILLLFSFASVKFGGNALAGRTLPGPSVSFDGVTTGLILGARFGLTTTGLVFGTRFGFIAGITLGTGGGGTFLPDFGTPWFD